MSSTLPVIIVLDIDATLVGLTTFLANHWLICDGLGFDAKPDVLNALHTSNIIRPHFLTFYNNIKKQFDNNVEFFIYTTAASQWAEWFIPCIEKVLGITFNRPIFANETHCTGLNHKSFDRIIPDISEFLKERYPDITHENIRQRIVAFDDYPMVYKEPEDVARVIPCPPYKSTTFVDTLSILPEEVSRTNFRYMANIMNHTAMLKFFPKDLRSFRAFFNRYTIYKCTLLQTRNLFEDEDASTAFWSKFDVNVLSIMIQ